MKIITVVGARPQFIKASAISRCIQKNFTAEIEEVLVHTGQHHDENMSAVFFDELGIPTPKYNLEISGGTHGTMTARMLESIENILLAEKPEIVLVYGDTNSTLAAALAAAKLYLPIAHVEAGLRSWNMRMPEEINRILTDRVSKYLFCPTESAIKNLEKEGFRENIYHVGDVMYDVALYFGQRAKQQSTILQKLQLQEKEFLLVTCHRAENTDNQEHLTNIMHALARIAQDIPVVFPIHPRTLASIKRYNLMQCLQNVCIAEPLPYLDMVALEQSAKIILTDSGGVQKEAFFYGVPCITMRNETEWMETIELGWNQLTGVDQQKIYSAFRHAKEGDRNHLPYGNGQASQQILSVLL